MGTGDKSPPLSQTLSPPSREGWRGNQKGKTVPPLDAGNGIAKKVEKTMDIEFLTWKQLKERAEMDRKLNGEKYDHLLEVAIAWLQSGGRMSLHRWAMRRDFETHLILDGNDIKLVECDGVKIPFCKITDLVYDEFLMIPDTHEIGEHTPYPEWIYGDLEVPQMRIKK